MIRVFRHYVPVAAIIEISADWLVFFFAFLLAALTQKAPYGHEFGGVDLVLAIGLASMMTAFNGAFGLYQRERLRFSVAALRSLAAILLAGAAIYFSLLLLAPEEKMVMSSVRLTVPYAFLGLILLHRVILSARAHGVGRRRLLIVGSADEGAGVVDALSKQARPRYHLVGLYSTEEQPQGAKGLRVFPRSASLWRIVCDNRIREVLVVARQRRGGVLPLHDLLECRANGVNVIDESTFYERTRSEFPIEALKASWLIYGNGFEQGRLRTATKRLFDLAFAAVLLILSAPVMVLTAVLVKLESPGPVIYRQERVGRAGRPFMCLKFRSMRADAERNGVAQWAQARDPRITRIGRWLRLLRIDELPQLFNVLAGDMSLVGPRPERPTFVTELKQQIPYYDLRHSVRPGLTGWAQVRYAYASTLDESKRKLQFDLYYVKNHSLFMDFLILLETVRVVLLREGAK